MSATSKSPTYALAGIGLKPDEIDMLKRIRIRTSAKLLDAAASPKGRKRLAATLKVDEPRVLEWANMADRMRVKGIGKDYAELLPAAGVKTVRELKYRNPANLVKALKAANDRTKRLRILPSEKTVGRWIERAKRIPLKITY